jgi:hypothetical protein
MNVLRALADFAEYLTIVFGSLSMAFHVVAGEKKIFSRKNKSESYVQ